MSTTDPNLPMIILDCMAASGIEFAVLHDEAGVAAGSTMSDVDLVTARAPLEILSVIDDCLSNRDIHPIVSWQYDVDSSSLFFTDGSASEGAQLDLVYGDTGLGNYGLHSAAILDKSEPGDRWMKASELHELLYSIRKRHLKRQRDELDELLAIAHKVPLGELTKGCQEIFSQGTASAMIAVLAGRSRGVGLAEWLRRGWRNAGRLAKRIRHPAGFWVALQGEDSARLARQVSGRFARLLPASGHGACAGSIRNSVHCLKDLAAVRWRAGVFATNGQVPPLTVPDMTLQAGDMTLERAMGVIVDAMENRLMS
ncbi:MAG TPA: hypothetical protein VF115_08170 [Acidimicrobiia bacterium]